MHTSDLHLGNKLQKEHFFAKYDCFLATYASILNPCSDGNVRTYASTKELKQKVFTINSQHIKQEIDLRVTFMLIINVENYIFSKNTTIF